MPLLPNITDEDRAFIASLMDDRNAKIDAMKSDPEVLEALALLHRKGCEPHIVHGVLSEMNRTT